MDRRKEIHLSLTNDQLDDLTSALEAHRDSFKKLASEAALGFGLGSPYWNGRVADVQVLLDTVRDLADGGSVESRASGHEDS